MFFIFSCCGGAAGPQSFTMFCKLQWANLVYKDSHSDTLPSPKRCDPHCWSSNGEDADKEARASIQDNPTGWLCSSFVQWHTCVRFTVHQIRSKPDNSAGGHQICLIAFERSGYGMGSNLSCSDLSNFTMRSLFGHPEKTILTQYVSHREAYWN